MSTAVQPGISGDRQDVGQIDKQPALRLPASTLSNSRLKATLIGALVFLFAFFGAQAADAAAYTKSVYPPNAISGNTQLEAWGDLSRDCSGTVGCYNYMKIERHRWWGVEYVAGNWANNNGWNSIKVSQPSGCFDYRTTVDSYNDIVGTSGAGVDVGKVGVSSSGTEIHRFRITWSSGWKRICR